MKMPRVPHPNVAIFVTLEPAQSGVEGGRTLTSREIRAQQNRNSRYWPLRQTCQCGASQRSHASDLMLDLETHFLGQSLGIRKKLPHVSWRWLWLLGQDKCGDRRDISLTNFRCRIRDAETELS